LFRRINWGFVSADLLAYFKRERRERRTLTEEEMIKGQWDSFERRVRDNVLNHFAPCVTDETSSFERFWARHGLLYGLIDEEEAKSVFEKLSLEIKKEKERSEKLKRRVEKIVMVFVNLGRICVKVIFNLSAVVAGGLIVLAVCSFAYPVADFVVLFVKDVWSWLISIEIMSVLKTGLTILGITALVTGVVLLTRRKEAPQGLYDFSIKAGNYIAWPFVTILKVLWVPLNLIGIGFFKVKEFVEVFYENNCPPITIIEEDV